MERDLYQLPPGLPEPIDDGGAAHLPGAVIPDLSLPSTSGGRVALRDLAARPAVLFFYPRTGVPGEPPGPGWDLIPGARGCTPQSCAFRDLHSSFTELGVRVAGVSTQDTGYQREFAARNHVPFDLLSDAALGLTRALRLPTFEFPVKSGGGTTLMKRMAWYVVGGRIRKVWYPVFPPNENAANVLGWLTSAVGPFRASEARA